MTDDPSPNGQPARTAVRRTSRLVHATRAPTPRACSCGMPVAFDPEKHEFFCIGCGGAKTCTCGRSLFGSEGRPVNIV